MNDEELERRLRAALTTEATRIPMTITSAELERRLALRGRNTGNRRLTLLLAAAVAVGALGVGGVLGGAIKLVPTASDPVTAERSTSPTVPVPTAPTSLPALDDFIAGADGDGEVLLAQSHDPFEGRAELLRQQDGGPSVVSFPMLYTAGSFTMTIVCLGGSTMQYGMQTDPGEGRDTTVACDGTVTVAGMSTNQFPSLVLSFREPVSWRVVVRGAPVALPLPTEDPFLPPADSGMEELVRMDDWTTDSTEAWGDEGLVLQETPPIPGRFGYHAQLWCPTGNQLRVILGDHLGNAAELTAETETLLRCTGLPMDLDLRLVKPSGSRIFVAAGPGARWSLLLTSETPPVAVVHDMPGWQASIGYGPDFSFEEHGVSFSNSTPEGGGQVLVLLECAGPPQQIEITVDVSEPLGDKGKRFSADCAPEGARTGQSFDTKGPFSVDFFVPAGLWIAATALTRAN